MFEVDWRMAVSAGLARYIEKNDDGDEAEDPLALARPAAQSKVGTAGGTAAAPAEPGAEPKEGDATQGPGGQEQATGAATTEGGGLNGIEATSTAGATETASGLPSARAQGAHSDVRDGAASTGLSGMIVGEVEQVAQVMWHHYTLICALFDFYAAIGASDDIFHISMLTLSSNSGSAFLPPTHDRSSSDERAELRSPV
jgi:hypothetical protein